MFLFLFMLPSISSALCIGSWMSWLKFIRTEIHYFAEKIIMLVIQSLSLYLIFEIMTPGEIGGELRVVDLHHEVSNHYQG